jgi:hypothetical protein
LHVKKLLAVSALCAVIWSIAAYHWGWAFAIGVHPYPAGTPWTYQLWSGFIPGLAIASLITSVWAYVRSVNCHVHGCLRVGRYPVAGGMFKVCGPHHPEDAVREKRHNAEFIHNAHWRLHGKLE